MKIAKETAKKQPLQSASERIKTADIAATKWAKMRRSESKVFCGGFWIWDIGRLRKTNRKKKREKKEKNRKSEIFNIVWLLE